MLFIFGLFDYDGRAKDNPSGLPWRVLRQKTWSDMLNFLLGFRGPARLLFRFISHLIGKSLNDLYGKVTKVMPPV